MVISIRFRRKTCEASSPSSSISLTRMDSLPDGIVEYILSKLSNNAKDIALCKCVSKKWKDSMSYRKSLCFPCGIFNNLTVPDQTPDSIVMQMVSSVSRLEELTVSCPFTGAGLASWLSVAGSSLKNLELRVLSNHLPKRMQLHDYTRVWNDCFNKLECIQAAMNLESLRLRRVLLLHAPKWGMFHQLRNLEIGGAVLGDSDLREALCATPNLTRLVLIGCKGLSTVCIELLELRQCHLEVYHHNGWSLTLRAPMIQYLMVKGSNWIRVHETNCLKALSVCCNCNSYQDVTMVEFGNNLMALESLSVKGFKGSWEVITKMLQLATQVKHLCLEFVVTQVYPFPYIDFVDFFESHPKLKSLHIGGGMIDTLCNALMTALTNVDSSFVIPCLEEVIITMQSPQPPQLNAEKMSRLIESFLKFGNKLNVITVNTPTIDFSREMSRMLRDSTTVSFSCDS